MQAALGSDIALAFDECTPYHADRDYTARSTERTHRWLDRCLAWHEREGPRAPGGVRDRPGRRARGPARESSAERSRRRPVDGLAIGGTLGRDKPEMRGVRRDDRAACSPTEAPRHLLGIGEPDDLVEGIARGHRPVRLRGADPPGPPRHGPGPAAGGAVPLRPPPRRASPRTRAPLVEGCPCAACAAHTRAYVHYLSRAEELTGVRLLALHNLTYLERLVRGARQAIAAGASATTGGRSSTAPRPGGGGAHAERP